MIKFKSSGAVWNLTLNLRTSIAELEKKEKKIGHKFKHEIYYIYMSIVT